LEQPGIRAHLRQQGVHQSRKEKLKELVDSVSKFLTIFRFFFFIKNLVKEENSFKELATIKSEYLRAQRVANRYRKKCEKLENSYRRQEEIFC
jgi:hypothetical protein